jgi:hypothetical protein
MSHRTIDIDELVAWVRAPIRNLNGNAWRCASHTVGHSAAFFGLGL